MILGFGKTETDAARAILAECAEALKLDESEGDWVGVGEGAKIGAIQKKYAEEGARFGKLSRQDAPERYSYFWAIPHKLYKGEYFVTFTIHHINRNHPFSPDGWASLVTRWVLHIDPHDGATIYCEA